MYENTQKAKEFILLCRNESGSFVEKERFGSVDEMAKYFARASCRFHRSLVNKRFSVINQMNMTGNDMMAVGVMSDVGAKDCFMPAECRRYEVRPFMLVDEEHRPVDVKRAYRPEITAAIDEYLSCTGVVLSGPVCKGFRREPVPHTGRPHFKGARSTRSFHHDMVAETIPEYDGMGRRVATRRTVDFVGGTSRSWKDCGKRRHQWKDI